MHWRSYEVETSHAFVIVLSGADVCETVCYILIRPETRSEGGNIWSDNKTNVKLS